MKLTVVFNSTLVIQYYGVNQNPHYCGIAFLFNLYLHVYAYSG